MDYAPYERGVSFMGYTIQVGAFADFENAVRLAAKLEAQGVPATFFRDIDGLNKVRFGNHSSKSEAVDLAERLRAQGVIAEFYIVSPEQYASFQRGRLGDAYVRDQIVQTARRLIDLPYRWGGTSMETGFDCSGLTMTVYQLNGMNLPRTSDEQFQTGNPVSIGELDKGDLLFFATGWGDTVSHVGIYIGEGRFIHAPGQGKTVRIASLDSKYHRRCFVGARSYL